MPIERPSPPERQGPDPGDPHYRLYLDVKDAIASLPAYFRTQTHIAGIAATDIHTLNTVLGATIEEQVVNTLNSMRLVWDPDEKYALYSFVRQAQTFPDVLLRRSSDNHILMGIELKGWYLLAKEGEPSFRYQVTQRACNPQDLIVVVPWVLSQVISGSPVAFDPYIESARYAAEYRNYHWQHLRRAKSDGAIDIPQNVTPYPRKSDAIADVPRHDQGGNFGRFARTGIMDSYMAQMQGRQICGVRVEYWRSFFKAFQDGGERRVASTIERLSKEIRRTNVSVSPTNASILVILDELKKVAGIED
jgi:hypothetical protein